MTTTPGAINWAESEGEPGAVTLYRLTAPFDKEPVRLVGPGMPARVGTASVLVESGGRRVFRADDQGNVASYDWLSHAWTREAVGDAPGPGVELFQVEGTIWASSPPNHRLYRRIDADHWEPLQQNGSTVEVRQVSHSADGVIVLTEAGSLLRVDAGGDTKVLVHGQVLGSIESWQDGVLAELGDWLLVAGSSRLVAYNRIRHQWAGVLSQKIDSFIPVPMDGGGHLRYYAVSSTTGLVWCVQEVDGQIQAEAVHLGDALAVATPGSPQPSKQPSFVPTPVQSRIVNALATALPSVQVQRLTGGTMAAVGGILMLLGLRLRKRRFLLVGLGVVTVLSGGLVGLVLLNPSAFTQRPPGPGLSSGRAGLSDLAQTVATVSDANGVWHPLTLGPDRAVHELVDCGLAQTPVVRPIALSAGQRPLLTAAREWDGKLLLGMKIESSYVVAVYDLKSLAWEKVEAPGRVRRFWPLSGSLLAEVEITPSTPDDPPRRLYALSRTDDARWEIKLEADHLYDSASDGRHVWIINARRAVEQLNPGHGTRSIDAFGIEHLPTKTKTASPIQAMQAVEGELIAHYEGAVWHYSLETLSWSLKLDGGFVGLLNSDGNILAVQISEGTAHHWHYSQDSTGSRKWVELPRGGAGEIQLPRHPRDVSRDLWEISTPEHKIVLHWKDRPAHPPWTRPNSPRPTTARAASHSISTRVLAWHDGELWCQTLATRNGGPVCRRFRTGNAGVEYDLDSAGGRGLTRFQITAAASASNLTGASPIEFQSERFVVASNAAGTWRTDDPKIGVSLSMASHGMTRAFIPVSLISTVPGRWELDVDVWSAIAGGDGPWLHAATRAGILTVAADLSGRGVERLAFRSAGPGVRFAIAGGERLAREDSGAFFAFDHQALAWREKPSSPNAAQVFSEEKTVLRSNRYLENWRVVGPVPYRLEMRTSTASTAPESALSGFAGVTLDANGFGFDRVVAVQLGSKRLLLEGPDGRIEYPDRVPLGVPSSVLPAYSTAASGINVPVRAEREAETQRALLVGADAVWGDTGSGWQQLAGADAGNVLRQLRETPTVGNGWEWKRDDAVSVAQAPFSTEKPLNGWFDTEFGQFSFDRTLDLTSDGPRLSAATTSGVMTWQDRLLSQDDRRPRPVSRTPMVGKFAHAPTGAHALVLSSRDGGAGEEVYRFDGSWKPVDAVAAAQQIVSFDRTHPLVGSWWSIAQTDNSDGARRMDALRFEWTPAADVTIHRQWYPARCWGHEVVNALCTADQELVLATESGLEAPGSRRSRLTQHGLTWVASHDERLHAADKAGQELWLDPKTLAPATTAGPRYAELKNRLLDSDRWRWKLLENKEVLIEVRPEEKVGAAWRTTRFKDGRFDFDRVVDVCFDGEKILCGTEAGFVERPAPPSNAFSFVDASRLPAQQATTARLFSIWRDGRRVRYVRTQDALYEQGNTWELVQQEKTLTEIVRCESEQQAQNERWHVFLTQLRGLEFRLSLNVHAEQPVTYVPGKGTFSFCDLTGVRLDMDSTTAIVASSGGILRIGIEGGIQSLQSDFVRPDTPAHVARLWRTDDGIIALIAAPGSQVSYRLWKGGSWQPIEKEPARKLIDGVERWINRFPDSWTVERLNPPRPDEYERQEVPVPTGPGQFAYDWQGQRLLLVLGHSGSTFAHDQALSAEWVDGDIWIATKGGIVRTQERDGRLVAPSQGPHLWTNTFARQRLVDIYQRQRDGQLICRTIGAGPEPFTLRPDRKSWVPLQEPDAAAVVHPDDGLWEWRREIDGRVRIVPNHQVFSIRDEETYAWFRGGQVAFWSVPKLRSGQDRLAAPASSLFVASEGGILRLSGDRRRIERVYAVDCNGDDLTEVMDVAVDPDQGGVLLARAGLDKPRVLRYRANPHDDWRPVNEAFPGRDRTVRSQWLAFDHSRENRAVPTFQAGISDSPTVGWSPLLRAGRFVYDEVSDFVWRETGATPACGVTGS